MTLAGASSPLGAGFYAWPRTFGRYTHAWQAYQALKRQTSDRFYVEKVGEEWHLKLAQR